MINDEDMAVASLASLVGGELKTIDKFTESGKSMPANKLDPRLFLNKNNPQNNQHKNKNVVYQEGKAFYAGIDEAYVQSLYPDPAPSAAVPPAAVSSSSVAAPVTNLPVVQPAITKHSITLKSEEASSTEEAFKQNLVKILKSIDKSLKTIANNLTINQTKSDQTTNQ
jgi:hypothetical protein